MIVPYPDILEKVDLVTIDPLVLERQTSRYVSRGIAYGTWTGGHWWNIRATVATEFAKKSMNDPTARTCQ